MLRWQELAKNALELMYPSNIYCICCDNLIDRTRVYGLCDECLQSLRWVNGQSCCKCGKTLAETERRKLQSSAPAFILEEDVMDNKKDFCQDCRQTEHFFDRGFTCLQYGLREKEVVHRFKFNGKAYMGDKLGRILLDRILLEEIPVDLVMAVPMHKKNQGKRGYNQSELMAKVVAKGLGVVYNKHVLIRKNYKAPMNKLDAKQRSMNVRGSYDLNRKSTNLQEKIQGKSVLLVDDVYTTGSTVDECSKLLKSAGVGKVYVLTLAAGVG